MLLDIVKKGSVDRSVCLRIIDSTDGTPETGVVFNTSGIDLWYRREGAAVTSVTEATLAALTTAHADGGFLHVSHGEYRLDLPDAAFATGANYVDVGGTVTGMIVIGGRVRLVDYDPEDAVRLGLTALPNAAAGANGGVPTGNASGHVTLADSSLVTAKLGTFALAKTTNITGFNDIAAAAVVSGGAITTSGGAVSTVTTLTNAPADSSGTTTLLTRVTSTRAGYWDNLSAGAVATAAQINSLQVNTRANLSVPVEIETPDSSTQVYKIRLHLFDTDGNMEAPDSTPTVALTNAAGTDRSGRLSAAANPSAGVYTWDYTATAGDAEEQLVWVFTVVEGGLTRTYPATSYVVEETAYRFSSSDRANLTAVLARVDVATSTRLAPVVAGRALSVDTDGYAAANVYAVAGSQPAANGLQTIGLDYGEEGVGALTATVPVAAGSVTAIQAGLATAAALATAAGYVDTEVAAIKAKTDALPAAPAAAGDIPTAAANAAAVWAAGTRTLTSAGSGGATAAEVWEYGTRTLTDPTPPTFPANFAALAITAAGVVAADVKKVNAVTVQGAGTSGNSWRPA